MSTLAPVEAPTAPTTGRWHMTTETSSYDLDLDAKTVTRTPGAGTGGVPDLPDPVVANLRGDTQAQPLLALVHAVVGHRALMYVDERGDGTPTERRTTIVTGIVAQTT